jgi:P pilus assembly protein, porin PapC
MILQTNLVAQPRLTPPVLSVTLLAALIAALLATPSVRADDYFNPNAIDLRDGAQAADLADFAQVGGQKPGTYRVTVYVNNAEVDKRDVVFVQEDGKLRPQLTVGQLKGWGVQTAASPSLLAMKDDAIVTQPGKYIPQADTSFNFNQQRLDVSIPQAAMSSRARDWVDPSEWDQGVTAALLNYAYSGSQSTYRHSGGTDTSNFLNLRSGMNFGPWRLRNYSTWSNSSSGGSRWNSVNSYLQRDIQFLRAQLTMGDTNTPGDVFDSVQFRGVQLASDDNQLPDSQRGFAPIIRGIARTNAQVTVRQNGYVIYQSYVPPGAFAITDLYPTGSQGNLDVTVKEADGQQQHFVQPFSALAIMQREGQLKYSATAGKYRSQAPGAREPEFGHLSLIYGLPLATTLYGGVIGAEDYQSLALGVGHGFGNFGSLSMDVTQANTKMRRYDGRQYQNEREQGQSWRLQYSKDIAETGTNFTVASYRYSTNGYYDFQEANEMHTGVQENSWWTGHKRSRNQLNISQTLNDYGSFYVAGYQQDYWGLSGYERNVAVGYNVTLWNINWGLNYTWTRPAGDRGSENQQFAFSMQVPLSRFLPSAWANYNVSNDNKGNTTQQAGLSGTALENNNLSYSLGQGYGNRDRGYSGYTTADYRGTYGELTGGYNYSKDTRQLNYGLQGGIVAHPHGITLSQPLGDTIAVVRAPGAGGTGVENQTGVRTDWRGYAVVPYVSAYRRNRVALDSQTLGDDVDLDMKTTSVTPTQGAVVMANFNTRVGARVLMSLLYGGKPVPFGATVVLVTGEANPGTGIVGTNGQVYLSGVPENGKANVSWGQGADQRCQVAFKLPAAEKEKSAAPVMLNAVSCK